MGLTTSREAIESEVFAQMCCQTSGRCCHRVSRIVQRVLRAPGIHASSHVGARNGVLLVVAHKPVDPVHVEVLPLLLMMPVPMSSTKWVDFSLGTFEVLNRILVHSQQYNFYRPYVLY